MKRDSLFSVLALAVALCLAGLQAWFTRFTMSPDGVSYLDMGDAFWRGDWHAFINGYWSPLYPVLLGAAMKLVRPAPYWEYPLAHVVNFLIFAAAIPSFVFLVTEFGKEPDGNRVPKWFSYSLFCSGCIVLIGVRVVAPDLLLAGLTYLASGLLLRAIRTQETRVFVWLGCVLGICCLTKSVMVPLSSVFIAAAVLRNWKQIPSITVPFLAILFIWVVPLSLAKHRATFGESGKLSYATCVDRHPQILPASAGLLHPSDHGFHGPGTFPLWYDPSYWHEGEKVYFNAPGQRLTTIRTLFVFVLMFLTPKYQLNLTLCLLLLCFIGRRTGNLNWPLPLISVTTIVIYALVFTEPRYLSVAITLLWICAFSFYAGDGIAFRRLAAVAAVTTLAATTCFVMLDRPEVEYSQPARAIAQGSELAINSQKPWEAIFAARLARAKIVGQSPSAGRLYDGECPF